MSPTSNADALIQAMTITELKEEIVSFTTQYKQALEKQTRAVLECERFERELEKLQNEVSASEEEVTNTNENDDENLEIINLEAKFEKLKLELAFAESEVELDVRRTHGRATESHIKSLVGIDENVVRLRNRIVDGKAYIKTKKAELQRERKEKWEQERQKRIRAKREPTSNELTALQEKIVSANREQLLADDEVEVLRKKLETLKLLVALATVE
jgi:predicted  nucleic acid-binding Zn-ribbon protein